MFSWQLFKIEAIGMNHDPKRASVFFFTDTVLSKLLCVKTGMSANIFTNITTNGCIHITSDVEALIISDLRFNIHHHG